MAAQRATDEECEAERLRLLCDPEALRDYIREQHSLRQGLETRLDEIGRTALDFLLKGSEPIDGDEREALLGIGRAISAWLPAGYRTPGLDDVEPDLLADLASAYRHKQIRLVQRPHGAVRRSSNPAPHDAEPD